jgi:hypothetical protein
VWKPSGQETLRVAIEYVLFSLKDPNAMEKSNIENLFSIICNDCASGLPFTC